MKKKNGFTLVELLAVIVILGVVITIAVVAVSSLSGKARKGALGDEAKVLFKQAMQEYLINEKAVIYDSETNPLHMENENGIKYSIAVNEEGKITCFQVINDTYQYEFVQGSDENIRNSDSIGNEEDIYELEEGFIMGCEQGEFDSKEAGVLKAKQDWLGSINKSNIEKIIITNKLTLSRYDVMVNADEGGTGSIVAYADYTNNVIEIVNKTHKRNKEAFKANPDSSNLFADFPELKSIDGIKLMDFKNTTNISSMFKNTPLLTSVYNLDMLNTSRVESASYAFSNTGFGSLLLSRWNISSLKDVSGMFAGSSKLTEIDISSWSSENIDTYNDMFLGCTNLVSIYSNPTFDLSSKSEKPMFDGDSKLKGGNGTTYSEKKSTYARCDGVGSKEGYFTDSTANGILSSKLYDTGTVSSSMTYLTTSGVDANPWAYQEGERLLEVDVNYMKSGSNKNLTISLSTGLYFVEPCKIIKGSGSTPVFTKLASQGTGTYENANTGSYKININGDVINISVQCKVMFDKAIWNKNASEQDTVHPYMFKSGSNAITVSYNNGTSTKSQSISNIKSKTSIGTGNRGYSHYMLGAIENLFIGQETQVHSSSFVLLNDCVDMPSYYEKVEYQTYGFCENSSGTVLEYAKITQGTNSTLGAGNGSSYDAVYTKDNPFKLTYEKAYTSGSVTMPRPKYTITNNACEGQTFKVYIKIKLTSYSGQVDELVTTYTSGRNQFNIRSTDSKSNDVHFTGNTTKTVPKESFYPTEEGIDTVGGGFLINTGFQSYKDIQLSYLFDKNTSSGAPKLKVQGINLPMMTFKSPGVPIKVELVTESGSKLGPYTYNYPCSGTCNASNNYIHLSVEDVKKANNITEKAYFKTITYTIPEISGGPKATYLYHHDASYGGYSGGVFQGRATAAAVSTVTISDPNGKIATSSITMNTNVTDTPKFAGYISDTKMPSGSTVMAGEEFELDVKVAAVPYPYAETTVFSKPELYMILPDGVTISSAIIVSDITKDKTSEVPVYTYKLEEAEYVIVKGIGCHIYKLWVEDDVPFGYYQDTSTGFTSMKNDGKWFRVKLKTSESMDTTTINLRESLLFRDKRGGVYMYGSYSRNLIMDTYNVDKDNSTTSLATLDDASKSVSILGKNN